MGSESTILNELAEGAGLGLVGRFAGRVLSIVGDILAARLLGPAVFGVYAIGWTMFRIVEIVGPMGLDRAVLRFGPAFLTDIDEAAFKNLVIQSTGLALIGGLLLGCITFAISPWLANDVFGKSALEAVLKFFAAAFPLAAMLSIVASITRTRRSVKYAVLIQDLGQPLSALILLAVLYLAGERLWAVLWSDASSYAFAIFLGIVFITRLFPFLFSRATVDLSMVPRLLSFSIPVAFGSIFSVLIFWVDRFFVGYYWPESEVGIYQVASQVSLLFAVILSGLSTILVPMFATYHHQNDRERLRTAYCIGNKWGLYLGLPVLVVFFLAPARAITTLYGGAYQAGWSPMVILLLGQTVNLATGASASLLIMSGQQGPWLKITAATLALDIALNIWLTPIFGIIGTAAATAISTAILYSSVLSTVRLKFGLWPYDFRYSKGILAACSAAGAVWLVGLMRFPDPLLLIIQSAVSVLTFGGILFLLGLDDEDKVFLDVLRRRLARFSALKNG
ncbi:MAG TPA: oligosaccharide flippase family protein [Anaerolineales bacterium]|jgi:O-antigen/teichoic acid export membrane protein|nr:oligosaccharide flippase family protein [Anaerolineales bacterium]